MLAELLSRQMRFSGALVRKHNPTVDWKQTPLQASHGEVSPYPVALGHPPDMDVERTLAEYRKVKTEDAPSYKDALGDARDALLHSGEEATPVKIAPHPYGGHVIVGGAGNRLNGLRLYGVRPDIAAVRTVSAQDPTQYVPQGVQAADYSVEPSEEDWTDYVNNLTNTDSDKRVNAEDGMATRNRKAGLQSVVSSRIPNEGGLVVVSPMARLREAHDILRNHRGNVGFYDEDGSPHGDVSRTAITPDPNFATMDIPRHIVYYDSSPNEMHKTHNVASAHRIISSFDEPVEKGVVGGHWRMNNGEPVWVGSYQNSKTQAVRNSAPPQVSGMSIHDFDGGAALSAQQRSPQPPVQPQQSPQQSPQREQNPLEAYAQLGTKSPYFQNWFKQSAVRHPDTGDAVAVYPAGTLNDTGAGLEELGTVRNALGSDLHFTSKPSSDPPQDINPSAVPVQYRHPMIDHLAALSASQGQGGVDPRLQRAFLATGNVQHLGVQNPDDQRELASSLQKIVGSNQASYLSMQNPIKLTQSLKPQEAQAILGGDPPLFHAVQAYKQSKGYKGADWGRTLNASDVIAGAASIGRQSQTGSIFGRAGYDGIYHRTGGEDHWIPFSPSQVKAQANVGTFDPQAEDIYKAFGDEASYKNRAPQPTPAQAEAGNYKKEHINLFGFNISIENKAGTYRTGTGKDGTEWRTLMRQDYGYIRGYEDKDGDQVDVFVGKNRRIPFVYVIDQQKADGTFDEHKCVFGAKDEEQAKSMYLSNYEKGWDRCGAVTKMSIPAFKAWLKGGGGMHPVALLKAIGEAV